MTSAKDVAVAATTELFGKKDPAAVDRWVSRDYIEHSATVTAGSEGLRALVTSLGPEFDYEPVRVLADGGFGGPARRLPGLRRYAAGRVRHPEGSGRETCRALERGHTDGHWDTVSGRIQIDGPTEVFQPEETEANRAIVAVFAEQVLRGADYSALTDYISTETYRQHNPEAADGLDGFGAAVTRWAHEDKNLVYQTIHKVIAKASSCSCSPRGCSAYLSPTTTSSGSPG